MPERAAAEVRVPGDKSVTHRALLLAALADGRSRLRGLLPAEDPRSTAAALRALGCAVPALPPDGAEIIVSGRGVRGLTPPPVPIDCGNSGTTARLLLGTLAGHPFAATLTGDASLRGRPMRRVTEPLEAMGAVFRELGAPDRLPVEVGGGGLRPIDYASPRASAQVKSALLLAGLSGGVAVRTREPTLSRDHTERMLRAMGVVVESGLDEEARPYARLEPPARLEPLDLRVPGDFSSAAFFLALAALAPAGTLRLPGVGVNPARTGLLSVLRRMGMAIERTEERLEADEPVADLLAAPAPLRGTEVLPPEIPALIDEVPILAILAARAEGETRITGAGELRVKESDRLTALAANLRALGTKADELPDGLVVVGGQQPLRGRVATHGDHRIAMAFGVLAALPGNAIEIDDRDVVGVSFPGFWAALDTARRALGAR